MSIRDNLVRKAVAAGIKLDEARFDAKSAIMPLTGTEKWIVRMAVNDAVLRWLEANEPEGGPEQYIGAAIESATAKALSREEVSR